MGRLPREVRLIRELLSAPRTFYVSPDGDDAWDGTEQSPFQSAQKAIDLIEATLDTGVVGAYVQFMPGIHTRPFFGRPIVGSAGIYLVGDIANPSNVTLRMVNADGFIWPGGPGLYTIRGFRIEALSPGYCGIRASEQSRLKFGHIEFGYCGHAQIMASRSAHVFCIDNYAIYDGAPVAHWYTEMGGIILALSKTITISGAHYGQAFARATQMSQIIVPANTFVGKQYVTGPRFGVETQSYMSTNQSDRFTYLPGNQNGWETGGGLYD